MQAYVLIIIATMCWGANTVFGLMAVGEVSPLFIVSTRWLAAALLISLFSFHQLKRDWTILIQHWKYILLMGTSGYTLFNSFYFFAAHATSAINLGIIQGAIPVFVLLGAFFFMHNIITKLQILGVITTLAGVLVVASKGHVQTLLTLAFSWGDILMLIACLFYAFYTIGLKYRPAVSIWSLLSAMAAAAFIISLPLLFLELGTSYAQLPTTKGWLIILMVILLPTLLAQASFIKGVTMIGPERASIFVNLVPVFSALFAVRILGETFQLYHALALSLVLGGIAIAEIARSDKVK